MTQPLIYLASPYSHPDPNVRWMRWDAACRFAAKMVREGRLVFSPIAHSHPVAVAGNLQLGWDYWGQFDMAMLSRCDEMWVLMLDGWDQSAGIAAEVVESRRLSIPVRYVHAESQEA